MLKEAKSIFIVGIGGIGTSGLARILKGQGRAVSGSDIASSEITEGLVNNGIKVAIGHRPENLSRDCGLLVYSVAVKEDNSERQKARQLNIPQLSYPEAVGELSKNYEKVIAVAGTNGKTTTTAMIGWILEQAGMDPTVLVGSKVLAWNSNARDGGNKYFIVEADEYRRAFLNYEPDIAVITNIEADHLDYFKDLEDVKKAFAEFASKVKPSGKVIDNYEIKDFRLKIPGAFNQANASAAAAACRTLGISDELIKSALENFTGTWRRFERIGKFGNVDIISDYAHHPSAIKAILETAREVYRGKKILTVFQPHQRNRTRNLFGDFVRSFCESKLNYFIIAEIFDVAGREEAQDQNINSKDLVREMQNCGKRVIYAKNLEDCEQKARDAAVACNVIIFMGAGDIYKVADKLIKT